MTRYLEIFIFIFYNKFLTIKAKYNVIEPPYMEGSTPDHVIAFVNEFK